MPYVDDNVGSKIYSKRQITSNWDRYKIVSNKSKKNKQTDFALLVNAPVSHGGHFQFKKDKLLASEINSGSFQSNNLFSLDLERLSCGLNTIPFYLRCGLPKDIFNVSFQTRYYTFCVVHLKLCNIECNDVSLHSLNVF